MEEKERYVEKPYAQYLDTETGLVRCNYIDLLNQQDKQIKELEEDQALLTMLISGIDNLMHDKDYRFKNDNGTWYSRQSCKDLTREEVYQEIIDEINQLDSNFEILDKENQQLKQSQNENAIRELEKIKEFLLEKIAEKQSCFDSGNYNDFADGVKTICELMLISIENQIKELGGGDV